MVGNNRWSGLLQIIYGLRLTGNLAGYFAPNASNLAVTHAESLFAGNQKLEPGHAEVSQEGRVNSNMPGVYSYAACLARIWCVRRVRYLSPLSRNKKSTESAD